MTFRLVEKMFRVPVVAAALMAAMLAGKAEAQVTVSPISTLLGNSGVTTPKAAYSDVYGNIWFVNTAGTSISEIPANGGPMVTVASGLSPVAQGVAADAAGNVYVSQANATTIMKIPAGGGTASTVGTGLKNVFQLAMDSAQNLYAADFSQIKIIKIPLTGSAAQTTLGLTGLVGTKTVAVDPAGNVYTTNTYGSAAAPTVSEWTVAGKQVNYALTDLTATGTSQPVQSAYGLAVDAAGNFFMNDSTLGKVYEYPVPVGTVAPVTLANCGGCGSLFSVSLTPKGEVIYMNSTGVYSVQSPVANFYGTTVGQTSKNAAITYNFPTGVTLGTPLYASGNSATAQFKDFATGDTCVKGKAIAAGGTCLLNVMFAPLQAGVVNGTVVLVDNATPANVLSTVYLTGVGDAPLAAFAPGVQSSVVTGLGTPQGLAMDVAGNLYVADTTKNVVTKTTAAGVTTTLAFTGLARPFGVAVDGAGTVWVSDSVNNAVYKLTTANVQSTVAVTGLSAPKGIALDGGNNLYIADSGNARVVKVDATGVQTVLGLTGLAGPSWLAVDATGNVYVSDTGAVVELPVGGAQTTVAVTGLSAAAGLAVSTSGTLLVADSGTGAVLALPSGGSPFALASGLKQAAGVVVAANGNVYVGDSNAGLVALADRTKETLTFAATASGATSAAMVAPVQNAGNAPLTLSGLAVTSGFALVNPAAATDCGSSTVLAAGASCNVDVVFTPTTLGPVSGTATVTDNALNATTATQVVTLVGTGIKASAVTVALTTPASGTLYYGQTPTLTATVAPASSTGVPTGNVTFALDGGSAGAPVALVNGQATFSPANLAAGVHKVVVAYAGDASFAASSSASFSFTMTPAVLTVTATSQTRMYNVANAALAYTITGFAYSETSSVVTGAPVLATTAATDSAPGTYPITVGVGTLASANYSFTTVAGTITVTQSTNVITFPAIANMTYGTFPIVLGATASSGLQVTYSVASGKATVTNGAGAAVTITGAGPVVIAADQAGTAFVAKAAQVTQSFTVAPAVLTVKADDKSKQSGQANPALTYTLSGLVNGDTSAVVTGTPALATTAVTASPVGTYPITIGQGTLAAANYTFSLSAGTMTVTGTTAQTITFGALANVTYGAGPIALTGSSSSGLALTYTVSGPAVLQGSSVVLTGVGTVTITANQAGNSTYAAATAVLQTFSVAKAVLTVTPASVSRLINAANPAFTYAITGYVNGDTSAVVSGAPSITTTAVTSSPVGTYPITATTGSLTATNYSFAFVAGTLTVNPIPQTITFGALPDVTYGVAPIALTGTASSGLAVTYTVTGPATVSGSTLTITGAGPVTVTAAQAGDSTYGVATMVARSFTVQKAPLTVTATDVSVVFGAAIPTTFAYTITGYVNGDTSAVVSGAPVVTTTATVSSSGGTYPITPTVGTLSAANYVFSNLVAGTLTIASTSQTITFNALPQIPQTTTTVALTATASSGLPVTYTVAGPATLVSTTTGSVTTYSLNITGPGTVTVTASQVGNSSYSAATPVVQKFFVTGTTTTTLTTSVTTVNVGGQVVLTAKVTGAITGSTPTGSMSFYAGTTLLGTVTSLTTSGSAVLTVTNIPSGVIPITAVYSGDTVFSGSTSAAVSVFVIASDFTASASSTNLTIAAGQSAFTTLTLTPVGNYSYLVNFSCGSLPSNLTCSFNPPAISFYASSRPVTTAQSVVLTVTAAAKTGALYGHGKSVLFEAAAFGALALLFGGKRRKSLRGLARLAMLAVLAGGALAGLTGCGASSSSTQTGTSNIQVIMDDGSGTTRNLTITVTVQ